MVRALQAWLVQHGEIVWDVQRGGYVLSAASSGTATSDSSTTPTATQPGTRRTSTNNNWGTATSEAIIEEGLDAEGEPDTFDFPEFFI